MVGLRQRSRQVKDDLKKVNIVPFLSDQSEGILAC